MSATEPGFDPADLAAISEALGIGDVLEAQRIILRAIEADRPEHLLGGQTVDRVGRCGTCVHWRATHLHPEWGTWDEDLPAQAGQRWGHCALIALPGYGEVTTLVAYVQDASEYEATLYARSDFGCTLHEAKP